MSGKGSTKQMLFQLDTIPDDSDRARIIQEIQYGDFQAAVHETAQLYGLSRLGKFEFVDNNSVVAESVCPVSPDNVQPYIENPVTQQTVNATRFADLKLALAMIHAGVYRDCVQQFGYIVLPRTRRGALVLQTAQQQLHHFYEAMCFDAELTNLVFFASHHSIPDQIHSVLIQQAEFGKSSHLNALPEAVQTLYAAGQIRPVLKAIYGEIPERLQVYVHH